MTQITSMSNALGLARDVLTDAAHAEDHHARAIGRDHVAGQALPRIIMPRTQRLESTESPHHAQHQGDGVPGQHTLAHIAGIRDSDAVGQSALSATSMPTVVNLIHFSARPLSRTSSRELRRKGRL